MSIISFVSLSDAEAYERKVFLKLPPDTLINGSIAPIQITVRWCEITPNADKFELEYHSDTPDPKGSIESTVTKEVIK